MNTQPRHLRHPRHRSSRSTRRFPFGAFLSSTQRKADPNDGNAQLAADSFMRMKPLEINSSENVIDSIDSITQKWCNGPNIFGALHHFDLRQKSSTAQRGLFVSCRVEEVSQFLKSLSASKRISGLIKCFRTPSKCYNLLTHWLQTHLPGLEGQETTNMVTNMDICQQDSCPNAEQAWRAICLDGWR